MAQAGDKNADSQVVSVAFIAWSAVLMSGLWLLLVGGAHRDEMIVGAFCVLGATWIIRLIARVNHLNMQFTLRDLATGWRLPGYMVQDLFIVTRVLLRNLLFGERPSAAYHVCGCKTSKREPRDVARRTLLTGYSSATPNLIVIGVDWAQSRVLFHQLEGAGVNQTMQDLGAEP